MTKKKLLTRGAVVLLAALVLFLAFRARPVLNDTESVEVYRFEVNTLYPDSDGFYDQVILDDETEAAIQELLRETQVARTLTKTHSFGMNSVKYTFSIMTQDYDHFHFYLGDRHWRSTGGNTFDFVVKNGDWLMAELDKLLAEADLPTKEFRPQ